MDVGRRIINIFTAVAIWLTGLAGFPVWASENLADYKMPPGIADPEIAIQHWSFSDPVLMWRLTSQPEDPFEPGDYFYWPDAVIRGQGGAFFPPAQPAQSTIDPAVLDAMAQWAEVRKSNALIVIHKGRLLLERYWNGLEPDTIINGRAMTRSMMPLLLGFAVADGKLSLDDPIGRYIPEWSHDPRGRITVRQVAQNVSGLEQPERRSSTEVYGNKLLCLFYCGDVNRAAREFAMIEPAGHRFNAADVNMQLLGMVIEAAMEQPVEVLLSDRIWKRIGASDATFQRDRPGGKARVVCCMRATARDWSRIGALIVQDGRWHGTQVIPAGWLDMMATPSPNNPNFGLGLWLGSPYVAMRTYYEGLPGVIPMSEPYLADDVRIIEGGGFRAVYASPKQELVVFRHGPGVPDWDGAYLINAAIRGMRQP